MNDPQPLKEIFLQPGELAFGGAHTHIRTLLGSCVAITLWHPARRIGGMCHYMLPTRSGPRGALALDGRYGDEALELLLQRIRTAGARASEFEAKLFGGGCMFERVGGADQVQDRNIAVGRELMAQHGFKVRAHHLGGKGHRQIIFEIGSGHVWVKYTPLPAAENDLSGQSRCPGLASGTSQ